MSTFSLSFLNYFRTLSENNSTAWFGENRRWYEKDVKAPFTEFIDELIVKLKKIDSEIQIEPSDAIFRINNDIRYTKEKIPYKPWMSAHISVFGKRTREYPGFYIQVNHERLILSGGVYAPEKDTLHQIRRQIINDPKGFRDAIQNVSFIEAFGGLSGDQNKQLPSEFRDWIGKIPEIAFKQYYYRCELSPQAMLMNDLPSWIYRRFEAAGALHLFLKKAFKMAIAA